MKITVITPVYNAADTIRTCIESVLNQTHADKEYIIVDGGSQDRTMNIVREYANPSIKWISEKDDGLYDAFNKGILMATGDIICFLCADDMYYHDHVLEHAAEAFRKHPEADIVFGDIVYVDKNDLSKIVRYWKSSPFSPGLFKKGWLPPNTALFIRRSIFLQHGLFNLKFKMASDYELQYRFFEKNRVKSVYVQNVMVRMRSGGMSNSSLKNMFTSLKECYLALKMHHVRFPLVYIINTLLYRIRQLSILRKLRTN